MGQADWAEKVNELLLNAIEWKIRNLLNDAVLGR